MNNLKKIYSFLKRNPRIIEYAVIFITVYFVAVIPVKNRLKQEQAAREKFEQTMINNVNALNDSIKVGINKNGDKISHKLGYAVESIDELKQFDKQLYEDIKNSDKDLKNYINSEIETVLSEVGKTQGSISQDSDSSYTLNNSYNYADSGLVHSMRWETPLTFEKGLLKKGKTNILDNNFNVSLNFSTIRTEDGKTKVIANSPSPLVKFNTLNNVYVDSNINISSQEKSRLGVGPNLGMGVTYINGNVKVFPYLGVGLNWNIWTIKRFK